MIKFIPFTVKLLPFDYVCVRSHGKGLDVADVRTLGLKSENIYTVVGITNEFEVDIDNRPTSMCLCIRSGEISVWYPQIFCQVVDKGD